VRDIHDLRRLTWAFTFGSILLAFLSIFVIGISKVSTGVSYDANDVGVLMVMSLPLAVLFVQAASTKGERFVALMGIGLMAATLVKTQSRGAFIGALIVCPALLIMPGVTASRRFLFVAAAVVTMVFAAPSGYWTSMQSILSDPKADYNWDAVNGRRNIARRGIGYMISYPVFGVGINNFALAEGTISDKARNLVRGQGIRWAAPHNSFVQAGAESGVTGLLLWVSLVLANVAIPLRLVRRIPKAWRKGTPDQRFLAFAALYLPIAQLGFLVTAFFVSFAWLEPLYFFSALVAGLGIIAARELRPVTAVNSRTGFRSRRSSPSPALTSQPTAAASQPA
jgi:O-antigen ligase